MACILVVDDEPAIRELLAMNLDLLGHEVVEAESGEAALETISGRDDIDALFLDVQMPGIDGIEVLRRLNEDDATAHIPVVLITARSAVEDRIDAWESGIVEFIGKPFQTRVLGDVLDRVLAPTDPTEVEARRQAILARLAEDVDHRKRLQG